MSSITINSNGAALNAQRRLGQSTASLQSAFRRLSSGLRVNRAVDDAAGLSISESLKTDSRVYAQGVRNLNDGISLLSIADSALSELSNITIRLTELAEQASNGALSNTQRTALDAEAQALRDEYFRISKTTSFNGRDLFESNFGELSLQAGYGVSGGIVSGLGGAIGTGELSDPSSISSFGGSGQGVSLVDVNGDGFLDFIGGRTTVADSVYVGLGQGDGTFSTALSYQTQNFQIEDLEVNDLNGDGVADIVVAHGGTSISVLFGNGDGSFGGLEAITSTGTTRGTTTGDFNGDSIVDIASVDYNTGAVSVFISNGDGSFLAGVSFSAGGGGSDIVSADLNGDGVLDLAVADSLGSAAILLVGNGDGSFKSETSISTTVTEPRGITTGDLNGDGHVDIITSDYTDGRVSVTLGRGDGTFESSKHYSGGSPNYRVSVEDLNGDGALDIISKHGFNGEIYLQLGNGDGTFKQTVTYDSGGGNGAIALGDVDSDGVSDLVSSSGGGGLSVFISETENGVSPLDDFSLASLFGARQALPVFQQKLDQLSSQRGIIGAFEARVSTAVATTTVTRENYISAASQITDVDVSQEAANLVRAQILQQAGTAILAQANQTPALALQLLA